MLLYDNIAALWCRGREESRDDSKRREREREKIERRRERPHVVPT